MLIFIFTPMICSFAFTFGLVYLKACALNNQALDKALPLTPENTIVVFDLHRVLFFHDYRRMCIIFFKSPLKWQLARAMLNPCLLWDIIKLMYRRPIPESFLVHLAHNYQAIEDLLPLMIEIANQQKRNEPVINFVKELKSAGFELAVLSNIGQRIFEALEPKHDDLFTLFDHIVVATPETHYVSKPNPKAYERLYRVINTNKQPVLVDDQEKNICGGIPFGIIGIIYKKPEQLKKQFKKLGITIKGIL